jgi:hypothetical protein
MRKMVLTLALCAFPFGASADVSARFVEGAPKDQFIFESSSCPGAVARVAIDLSTASAGLIFDVTAAGAGVSVFQPVEVVRGSARLGAITDGDQVLTLDAPDFSVAGQVWISADIDDSLTGGPSGQTIVRGSEIAGVTLRVFVDGAESVGLFNDSGWAVAKTPACMG